MQLPATSLAELVRSLRSHEGSAEKRKQPRVGLRAKADIELAEQTFGIWVRDISAGGVGITCSQEIPIETRFELILSDDDRIGCVVCHCHRSAQRVFTIGA